MPFPEGKTIKELGIDTKRKFRVVGGTIFNVGDIVILAYDDNSAAPLFKRLSDSLRVYVWIYNLEYYDDPSEAIPLITTSKNIMTNVLEFFRSMTATADEKLLKELGIEDPIGTPTDTGLKLSAELSYRANRAEIIEIAKKMKEAQEK